VPTYQYACTECGHFFEQFQSFTDDALTECPVCTGKLRKVFNAVGVVFKGSGFYRNDSRTNANGPGSSEQSGGGSKEKTASSAEKSSSGEKSSSSTSSSTAAAS
jgi:putative FmdB family regulatory protein